MGWASTLQMQNGECKTTTAKEKATVGTLIGSQNRKRICENIGVVAEGNGVKYEDEDGKKEALDIPNMVAGTYAWPR